MWQQLVTDNRDFEMFSIGHILPVVVFVLVGFLLIRKGRSLPDREDKLKLAFWFSLPAPVMILGWLFYRLWAGTFDIQDDLPVHLCNFVSLILPFYFLRPSKKLFGVLYFWIMVGTFQAVVTPGLEQAFPHFWYFRYWVVHCGLIILVLYGILVLNERLDLGDLKRAFWVTNLYVLFTLSVNYSLGTNYFYTLEKPQTASLLDILGPWPWYLFSGQFMMLAMFSLYLLPFFAWKANLVYLNRNVDEANDPE